MITKMYQGLMYMLFGSKKGQEPVQEPLRQETAPFYGSPTLTTVITEWRTDNAKDPNCIKDIVDALEIYSRHINRDDLTKRLQGASQSKRTLVQMLDIFGSLDDQETVRELYKLKRVYEREYERQQQKQKETIAA